MTHVRRSAGITTGMFKLEMIDHRLIGTLVGNKKSVERVEKCAIKIYISTVLVATRPNPA